MLNQLDRIYGVLMESKRPMPSHQTFLNDMPSFTPPIAPAAPSGWIVMQSPQRLVRTFEFDEFDDLAEFVVEVLAYERDVRHNAKHTIDNNTVVIEVYTRGPNYVTELDIEYRNMVDSIHEMLFVT